jgi:hypothetical protein
MRLAFQTVIKRIYAQLHRQETRHQRIPRTWISWFPLPASFQLVEESGYQRRNEETVSREPHFALIEKRVDPTYLKS